MSTTFPTVLCVQADTSFDTAFGSIAKKFQGASGPKERANVLLKLAEALPHMPADMRINDNRVMGCTSQVRLLSAHSLPIPTRHFVIV